MRYAALSKNRTTKMGDAERYRKKATELKAFAKLQTDYILRSEYEYMASVYSALADKADEQAKRSQS
jgi:hypothetical protein